MSRVLKNIAKRSLTGFLLLALSGLTIAVHHEHAIGNITAEHEHGQPDGLVVKTSPQTYHEVHFVRLLSGDSFSGSQKLEFKKSLINLFAVHLHSSEFPSFYHSTSLVNIDIKETGPPSVDKCVLFCSFLI